MLDFMLCVVLDVVLDIALDIALVGALDVSCVNKLPFLLGALGSGMVRRSPLSG